MVNTKTQLRQCISESIDVFQLYAVNFPPTRVCLPVFAILCDRICIQVEYNIIILTINNENGELVKLSHQ